MPSAHEKARLAKKKEAAKKKGGKKAVDEVGDQLEPLLIVLQKIFQVREDDSKEGTPVAGTPKLGTNGVDLSSLTSEEKLVMALEEESRMATEARACTGYF